MEDRLTQATPTIITPKLKVHMMILRELRAKTRMARIAGQIISYSSRVSGDHTETHRKQIVG